MHAARGVAVWSEINKISEFIFNFIFLYFGNTNVAGSGSNACKQIHESSLSPAPVLQLLDPCVNNCALCPLLSEKELLLFYVSLKKIERLRKKKSIRMEMSCGPVYMLTCQGLHGEATVSTVWAQ